MGTISQAMPYAIGSARDGGGRPHTVATIRCTGCGASASRALPKPRLPDSICRSFAQQGWDVAAGRSQARCPACAQRRRRAGRRGH